MKTYLKAILSLENDRTLQSRLVPDVYLDIPQQGPKIYLSI
jgi:hypothetical protein